MGLPTLARTWRFQANQTIAGQGTLLAQNQNLLFAMIQSDLAAGTWTDKENATAAHTAKWAHQMSCDSTAVSSVTDKWAAASNLVWSGGAHSWRVDYNASQGLYRLLDLSNVATTSMTMRTSHIGFGAAHGGVDGTTTTAPTATTSQLRINNATWGGSSVLNTATVLHALQSTDGLGARMRLCRGSAVLAHWVFDTVGNPISGLTFPSIQYVIGGPAASGEVVTYSSVARSTGDYAGIANVGTQIAIAGLTYGGSEGAGLTGPDLFTTLGSLSGGYPFFGINLSGRTAGTLEPNLGVFTDMYYGLTALATGFQHPGDEVTSTDRRQFTKFGPWVDPWNKSVVVIA